MPYVDVCALEGLAVVEIDGEAAQPPARPRGYLCGSGWWVACELADRAQCAGGGALFGAIRGPRPSADKPPHEKFPAVHSTDRILNLTIVLIRISYLPVCAIHGFAYSNQIQ